jgi:hypothetical protein
MVDDTGVSVLHVCDAFLEDYNIVPPVPYTPLFIIDEHYVYDTGATELQVCDVLFEDYNILVPVPTHRGL